MSTYAFITTRRAEHVLIVTIARSEVTNALHPSAHVELAEAFDCFATDDDL